MKTRILLPLMMLAVAGVLISGTIDLDDLFNYADQDFPDYITRDNTLDNPIDDRTATLGRVLFYDTNLSSDGSVSCASCHLQEHAFGDTAIQSVGVNGLTIRHSMRLVNPRFSNNARFFWDERASSLELQTTQPIEDHLEMGFSGTNGDPTIDDLIAHMETLEHYQILFDFAFGDSEITEERMQLALAQFVRSIQSFDSRFDEGMAITNDVAQPFPNFTAQENLGKILFLDPPGPGGGAGCASCHEPPEFAADPLMLNNGVIGVAGMPGEIDIDVKRAPTLRDVVKPDGSLNGPLMHDGSFTSLLDVVNHYNAIPDNPLNTFLDPRLTDLQGQPQQLNLTEDEKLAIVAFIRTLSGNDIYTNEKWSDPFDPDGSIEIIGSTLGITPFDVLPEIAIAPNPVMNTAMVQTDLEGFELWIYDAAGRLIDHQVTGSSALEIDLGIQAAGLYFMEIQDRMGRSFSKKIIKQ